MLKRMITYLVYANMVDFRIALVLLLLEKIPYYYNIRDNDLFYCAQKIRLAAKEKVNA